MLAALMRMAALLALLTMPFGMAMAPAAPHAAPGGASEHGHCGEEQEAPEAPTKQSAHCAVCAALPATGLTAPDTLLPTVLSSAAVAASFDGIELEIATPPPKSA